MTQLKYSNKNVVTKRRTTNEWNLTTRASIEWILSSAGAQNHTETAIVELSSYENTMQVSGKSAEDGFCCALPMRGTRNPNSTHVIALKLKTNESTRKMGNKRKVEEKAAAQQQIVGTFSLYQVLNTIGYVPVRLVISYHNLYYVNENNKKRSQQNELSRARHSKRHRIYLSFDDIYKKNSEDLKRLRHI